MFKKRTEMLSTVLSFLVLSQFVLPPAWAQNPPRELNIVVVDGEGAIHNVGRRAARVPTVAVEDENHNPIPGAVVVFSLPTEGASGEFGNGLKNVTVTTDKQGRAIAPGLKVNHIAGKIPIHITASYRGVMTRTNMMQFSMAVPGKSAGGGGKIAVILALIGAAAAGGAVAATRKGSGGSAANSATSPTPPTTPASPIGITPGVGTVGPPH